MRLGLSVGRKAQEPQGEPKCNWATLNYRVSVDAFKRAADSKKQTIDKGDGCRELIGVVERGECARCVCHTWGGLTFYLAQSEQND